MFKKLLFIAFLFITLSGFSAGSKITVYFNRPVNTTFSHGTNAVYLNKTLDDTLVAYINRAKQTIDIAVYEYIQSGTMANIATALNNAYSRGVRMRIIYDGKDHTTTSFTNVNAYVQKLASPNGTNYNIMHNKFMIIDANSPDANDPLVWTGSCNWTELQFNTSYNNVIIVQDQALARNYLKEFNQMWGDTGLTPNLTLSKFGPFKANITGHSFMVGSTRVENYFSPSDGVNTQILNAANTANKELFFGVYTFTRGDIAGAIATRYRSPGYTVKGIIDVNSQNTAYQAYDTLYPLMGANMRIYTSTGVYHNKMMIVDPDYPSSDPLVLTGSHNWSTTANTTNDENTLIVHDADIANQYLQSFAQNFIDLGGSISPVNTGIEDDSEADAIRLYPNPTNDKVYLSLQDATEPIEVAISDLSGQVLSAQTVEPSSPELSLQPYENGIYLIKLTISGRTQVYRIIKM